MSRRAWAIRAAARAGSRRSQLACASESSPRREAASPRANSRQSANGDDRATPRRSSRARASSPPVRASSAARTCPAPATRSGATPAVRSGCRTAWSAACRVSRSTASGESSRPWSFSGLAGQPHRQEQGDDRLDQVRVGHLQVEQVRRHLAGRRHHPAREQFLGAKQGRPLQEAMVLGRRVVALADLRRLDRVLEPALRDQAVDLLARRALGGLPIRVPLLLVLRRHLDDLAQPGRFGGFPGPASPPRTRHDLPAHFTRDFTANGFRPSTDHHQCARFSAKGQPELRPGARYRPVSRPDR